ncbi:MAG TPA: deaminase [Gaiellaceae bacterium]|nr:deaminase [Gaiellaceae bacterium]
MTDERELLRRAVALARENAVKGGRPFGALVVRGDEVLGEGVNEVLSTGDPTAHAEVQAIRAAGTDLAGATLLASCEPCPMCRTVASFAGVARIVYAASAEEAARAGFGLPPAPPAAHLPVPGAEEPFAVFSEDASTAPPAESPVRELRVALTVEDYEQAIAFYRDALGLPVVFAWHEPEGRGAILAAGHATLELISTDQAELIDRVEVGERVAGPVRLALSVEDSGRMAAELTAAGGELLGGPAETPWRHLNARIRAPDGMQLTLFTVLEGAPS